MDLLSIEIQGKNFMVVHFHAVNKTGEDAAVLMVRRAKDAVIWQDSLDGDEEHGQEVCAEACVPICSGMFGTFFLYLADDVQQPVIFLGWNVQIGQPAQPVEEPELDFMYEVRFQFQEQSLVEQDAVSVRMYNAFRMVALPWCTEEHPSVYYGIFVEIDEMQSIAFDAPDQLIEIVQVWGSHFIWVNHSSRQVLMVCDFHKCVVGIILGQFEEKLFSMRSSYCRFGIFHCLRSKGCKFV